MITLRLNVPHVCWSNLKAIKELVHLENLHLCEDQGYWDPPGDWAFRRTQITNRLSPFHYLTKLRSLHLELFGRISSSNTWGVAPFLQPISCMTKLGALTLLMQGSYCTWDIQYLSQLSHLTSLGVATLEQGISSLVKLEQLSIKATQPPAQHFLDFTLPTLDLSTSLAMLTNLKSLKCGYVLLQQVPNLTALTALSALTVSLNEGMKRHAPEMIWSSFSKLPSLISFEVDAAHLEVSDFKTIALMTQLTKLHFCGYTTNLHFSAGDLNEFSALSLQPLHLEFEGLGWSKSVQKLDMRLKRLYDTRSMHYFQVIFNLGKCERVINLKALAYDSSDSGDSEHRLPLQWMEDDSFGVSDLDSYLDSHI